MSSCTVACQRTVRQCQLTCGKKLEKVEERMSEKKKQTEELVSQRIWWGSTPADVHSLYVCVVLLLDDVRCAAKLPPCISLWFAAISFVQTDQQHRDESLGLYVGYKRSRPHPFSSHLSSVTRLWIATFFSPLGNLVHLIYSFPPLEFFLNT